MAESAARDSRSTFVGMMGFTTVIRQKGHWHSYYSHTTAYTIICVSIPNKTAGIVIEILLFGGFTVVSQNLRHCAIGTPSSKTENPEVHLSRTDKSRASNFIYNFSETH